MYDLAHATTARPPSDATTTSTAYGAYGCCCPDTAFLRACPLTNSAFSTWNHDVYVDASGDRRDRRAAGTLRER